MLVYFPTCLPALDRGCDVCIARGACFPRTEVEVEVESFLCTCLRGLG